MYATETSEFCQFDDSENRGHEGEANHETRTNKATIRDSKLLRPLKEGRFVISTSSGSATALVPCSWDGHVRAIQLLHIGIRQLRWWIVDWAISSNLIDYLIGIGNAMRDSVSATIEIFFGGEGEWVGRLIPSFADIWLVGAGRAVHRED